MTRIQDRPDYGSPARPRPRPQLRVPTLPPRLLRGLGWTGGVLGVTGALAGAGLGIAALIPDPIHQGTVIGRDYDDPDTWTTMEPLYGPQTCTTYGTGSNRTTFCSSPIIGFLPHTWHDGPHWSLKLQAHDDGRTGWTEVDQLTYDGHPLGADYDDGYRDPKASAS